MLLPLAITVLSVLSLMAIITSIFAFNMALKVKIDIEAMKRSTHNIQYVPLEEMPIGNKLDDDVSQRKLHEHPSVPGGDFSFDEDAL